MLYSREREVIILEIPKTGTVALSTALKDVCEQQVDGLARHAAAYRVRRVLGPDVWERCETVAVIREPTAWLQSWYRFLVGQERLSDTLPFEDFVHRIGDGDLVDGQRIGVRSQFERVSDLSLIHI